VDSSGIQLELVGDMKDLIFFSLFSRILVWLLLELTQTSETLVIMTIHIVAIQEHNKGHMTWQMLRLVNQSIVCMTNWTTRWKFDIPTLKLARANLKGQIYKD